ncbi:lipocalin family protein [Rhizobium sp. Leaf311]|uniref:lipocalin family protein n=1 Tax=Rhizobium sp. Leaf311 TaxID=1736332 RepID=UPI0009E79850
MTTFIRPLAAALAFCGLSACLVDEAKAETGVVRTEMSHYTGKWLEIGRTPMWLTDGCVAGFTIYKPGDAPNKIAVQDGCREGSPQGDLKTVEGIGTISDYKATNAKLKVRYPLFITFNYWVRYQSPDRSWFISSDPDMKNLWIYARSVPSKAKLAVMVKKAKDLGYDTSKLEFPEF